MKRVLWLGVLSLVLGCTQARQAGPGGGGGGDSVDLSTTGSDDGGSPSSGGPCVGLQCQQHTCGELTTTTTITGTVYDPAGRNPLYDVVVFVPNSTPKPLPAGASCDSCGALYSGDPVVVALTDAAGHFTLTNAPDGTNIPLVVQIGKWRRQFVIPTVNACTANALPDKMLTLPKNHAQGDLPNLAISTGGADTLECLLVRIGVDPSEYVGGANGTGHVHIFAGGGGGGGFGRNAAPNTSPPGPYSSMALWNTQTDLMKFDAVLLSCEGRETANMNQAALHAYASAGGRVFASHFHYAWFNSGPYASEDLATWTAGSNDMGNIAGKIVTTFPKGKALSQWLGNVSALSNGELPIQAARHNADVSVANKPSQAWIVADQNASPPNATEYFSFNTPTDAPATDAGVPNYCGRVVYSDLHVGAASGDYAASTTTPEGCATGPLSPQEKALEFMLFDLSSCVVPDDVPPEPPIQ